MQDQPEEAVTNPTGAAPSNTDGAPVQPRHDVATAPAKPPAKEPRARNASQKEAGNTKKVAPLPWTFPKNTLEDAIKIARAIEEQNAGNPIRPELLMKAVGYNSLADWRFLDLLRSANQYGLVVGTGKKTPVALTDIGRDLLHPVPRQPARRRFVMLSERWRTSRR